MPNNYKLLIDYREKHIIDLIGQEQKWNNVEMTIEITNLPVADFVFIIDNEQEQNKSSILIERKTYSDLESSIKDGRFRQQKSRLIESTNNPQNILYIIETNKNIRNNNIVFGSILNMIYKHNFKVLFSKSHEETLTLLSLIYKKLQNGDININREELGEGIQKEVHEIDDLNTNYSQIISPLKLLSKGDNIKNKLFQCILTVIPGVSISIANKIVELYPTLKILIDTYEKLENDKLKENLLANIQINSRKLGPALSKKIWKTLYFNSIE